jgi:protein TonB
VGIHILLLILLLRLAPPEVPPLRPPPPPISIDLLPEAPATPTPTRVAEERRSRGSAPPPASVSPATPEPLPREAPKETVPEPPQFSIWSQVIPMSRQDMAAADVGRMPSRAASPGSGQDSNAPGGQDGDSDALGRGPNGEKLYNADWYRRPTRAELSTYIPRSAPRTGWGMIACQTVADFRVDDCQEIAESPAGSGLAGAVRQAAWQFRVRPPRIGGRPLVGAWVRIRIEYGESED